MTETNTAQMVADLQSTDAAIRGNGWVAPGLGMPGAPMGLLGSSLNPLSGLAAAGLGWFMPLVSFLGDGLTQLQGGNDASVSSGSKDFGDAGRDIAGVADTYRASTTAQTSEWSGEAAAQYRDTGAQYADGIAGLGEGSNSVGSAIIGAGQVVAQAIAEVTELIAEAVAQIVPIMTQAVARAGETFGQSIAEAIPPCVGIAVEYALRIAAKLAALVASGDNLMKLVQGGLAVVELIQRALSGISQQSVQGEAQSTLSAATGQAQGGGPAGPVDVASTMPTGGGAGPSGSSSAPGSSGGGVSAVPPAAGGSVSPQGTHSWTPPTMSSSSGAVPPAFGAGSDLTRSPGQLGGSGLSGAVPSAVAVGAGDRGPGSRVGVGRGGVGRGGETGGQASAQSSGRTAAGMPGALPMGAMGAGRGAGDTDKEHQRKYDLTESHEEDIDAPPSVITGDSESTNN
jgi:uncharacterized protein YukE